MFVMAVRPTWFCGLIVSISLLTGCTSTPAQETTTNASAAPVAQTPAASVADARPRIVVLGDSLTAGLGLTDVNDSFPTQVQKRLDAGGYRYKVVNMGVSGDTSAGGVRRLDWSLDGDVRILILA